ncbi:MAG: tRNA (adenosine(37)-N6)-threonylcarbamoyltransferase complex dimerization subunit type 1 TsaB [Synergistaceae bacterium]|nr:tRNA (adenosine(37)-N6)-threonylcarbamoyltransferase complex dimerization subunit type 1 TsaB [Synergistaceae bacterium]
MKVLGIDCTTKFTNIGITSDGTVLSEVSLELGRQQSSRLPILIEEMLSDLSMDISELDLIAAANGPGYYTGIRTGIAYSAALAKALGIRILPVSSLETFVHDLRTMGIPLAPVIKARQNCIYCALYFSDGSELKPFVYPKFCAAAEFAEFLCLYPEALLIGKDVALFNEFSALPNNVLPRTVGRAAQTALMGEFYKDLSISPDKIQGAYLREPDIGPTSY